MSKRKLEPKFNSSLFWEIIEEYKTLKNWNDEELAEKLGLGTNEKKISYTRFKQIKDNTDLTLKFVLSFCLLFKNTPQMLLFGYSPTNINPEPKNIKNIKYDENDPYSVTENLFDILSEIQADSVLHHAENLLNTGFKTKPKPQNKTNRTMSNKEADTEIRKIWLRILKEIPKQNLTISSLTRNKNIGISHNTPYSAIRDAKKHLDNDNDDFQKMSAFLNAAKQVKNKTEKNLKNPKSPTNNEFSTIYKIAQSLGKPVDFFFYDIQTNEEEEKDRKRNKKFLEALKNDASIPKKTKLELYMSLLNNSRKNSIREHILSYF